jgi:drug/metabolite transporter superfamily protein YnfA
VNLNRLTLGGRIVAIAGLLLFIDSFLPWFRACAELPAILGGGKVCGGTHNAWNNALSLIAVLVALALVGLVLAELAGTELPALGTITWAQVQLIAGGVVALFVVLQVLIGDSGASRSYGAYLGIVFAAALLYGTFLRSREPSSRPIQGPAV